MRDAHPLGPPGGAGGVDDVRQVLGRHLHVRRLRRAPRTPHPRPLPHKGGGEHDGLPRVVAVSPRRRTLCRRCSEFIRPARSHLGLHRRGMRPPLSQHWERGPGGEGLLQQHELRPVLRQRLPQALLRQQHRHGRVAEHVGQALGRVVGVQGEVGAAGLPHAQHRHEQLRAALQAHAHGHFGSHAPLPQSAGEAGGAPLQLRVGEGLPPAGGGGGVGGALRLLGEEARDQAIARVAPERVPLRQELALLVGADQAQGRDGARGVGGGGLQEEAVVLRHALDGGRLEQVRPVGQLPRDPVTYLEQGDAEVELGPSVAAADGLHLHLAEGERAALHVLEGEHHLEERVVHQAPLGGQLLHQALEGEVLVLVGAQRGLAHPLQQLREGRVAGQVGAQHESVDEEADQRLQLGAGAVGDGGAHHHVVLARVAAQEYLPPGQQRHEHRGALAASRAAHRRRGLRGEGEGAAHLGDAQRRAAGMVGRQLQDGRSPRQALAPVGELALQDLAREPAPLPRGEVRVLDGKLGEGRLLAARVGPVQGGDLLHQHPHGPAVADHVVHGELDGPVLRSQAHQEGVQERPLAQVERALPLLHDAAHGLLQAVLLPQRGHVHHRGGERRGREDHLHRLAVPLHQRGAHRLVAAHQLRDAAPQRRHVQRAAQAEPAGHVVGGADGVELVDEPEPLLREGERRGAVVRSPGDALRRGALSQPPLQEEAPLRGEPVQAPALVGRPRFFRFGPHLLFRPCVRLRPHRFVHALRQRRHGGRLEHGAQRYLHPELLPHPRHHARGEEGVAAQVEEVGVDADLLPPEHGGEYRRQSRLGRGARRRVSGAGIPLRRGEGPPVQLAARGEREGVQRHQGGGHHVLREARPQEGAQLHRVRPCARADDVAHQPLLPRHHHGVAHGGVPAQRGLHLAGLDAEAAHLDLLVDAAQELQRAVREAARAVAGAVQALPRRGGEGVGDEALRRQVGAAQVPARELRSAQVQLPGDAGGDRLARAVQHHGAHAVHRPPDRHRGPGLAPGVGVRDRLDAHLRGTVQVHHLRAGRRARPLRQLRRQGLAPAEEAPQPRAARQPPAVRHGRQQRGDHLEDGDALALHDPRQRVGIAVRVRRGHHQRGPGQQRGPELPDGGVEAHRSLLQHPVVRGERIRPQHPAHVAGQRSVRHRHALGGAGGAGGVDDVGQVVGTHVGHRRVPGRRGLAVHQHDLDPVRREPVPQPLLRQQHPRAGVRQREGQAVRGVAGVQGDVGGAGPEDAEQGGHQLRRALHADPHPGVGADAHPGEAAREPVRAAVQLRVGERLGPGHHGGRAGGAARLLREERVHALARGLPPGDAPVFQERRALGGGEEGGLGDGAVGRGGELAGQGGEVPEHALDGGRLEQLRAVEQGAADPLSALLQRQAQVELGHRAAVGEGGHAQPLQAQGAPGRPSGLEGEHRLEERRVGHAPLGVQLLHQPLERHLLVPEGAQRRLPHPPQQLAEGRRAVEPGAEHEGVDEEADQPLQLGVGAAGDRGPDAHVVLPRPAREQELPRRQQRHEGGGPLARSELPQRAGGLRGDGDLAVRSPHSGDGGTGTVRGDLEEGRRPRQALPPVAQLALQRFPGEALPLPDGEVGVLHRELRERRRLPAGERLVEDGDLAHQHVHAPRVADHVVQGEERRVLLRGQAEQRGAQQRAAGQVEGAQRLLRRQPPGFRAHVLRGESGQLHDGEGDRGGGADHLHGLPVLHHGEHRAQRLVPAHHLRQGAPQHLRPQRAQEPQRVGHVVGGAGGVEPVDEPEALLGEGEWGGTAPGTPGDVRRRGARRLVHPLREGRHRGPLEDAPHRHLHPPLLADARDDAHGQERVPAQGEEAVVHAHALHPQHLGEDRRQPRLRGGAGRHVRLLGAAARSGKGAPVELAAGGERERVQDDERGGEHVLRNPRRQVRPQLRRRHRLPGGDHVGHDPPVPRRVLAHHGHRPVHARVRLQRRLDLPRLDAEAAHFHLEVRPPEVLQLPRGRPAHPVHHPVHPRSGLERIREVALGGQLRPAGVPARQPVAREVQLPHHAHGHRLEVPVQHVRPRVRHRPPDVHLRPAALHPRVRGVRRVLRRAVQVPHLLHRREPVQPLRQRVRQRLAAQVQRPHARRYAPHPQQRRRRARDHAHVGHRLLHRSQLQRVLHQHQLPAPAEGAEDLRHRHVEVDRRGEQHRRPLLVRDVLPQPVQQHDGGGVPDHHPLGTARRSRGEDHVRQVLRQHPALRDHVRLADAASAKTTPAPLSGSRSASPGSVSTRLTRASSTM